MTPHENRTVAEFDITKMDSYHCHYVLCTSVVFNQTAHRRRQNNLIHLMLMPTQSR